MPGEDEPLHAFVTGNTQDSVTRAVARVRMHVSLFAVKRCNFRFCIAQIKEVIRQGIEVPENQNDLRRNQLRELALLNGTLRESDGPRCSNCGSSAHRTWQCPDKQNVTNNITCNNCGGTGHVARDCKERKPVTGSAQSSKIDEEYLSLMAELGQGPPPPKNTGASSGFSSGNSGGTGFSLVGSQSSQPRAIAAPPPPSATSMANSTQSLHGLLPTPAGSVSASGLGGANSWGRGDTASQPSTQNAYSASWAQYGTAATTGAAYDPSTYAQMYAQQAQAATWMQAWAAQSGQQPAASVVAPPPAPASATNPWAAYGLAAGIAAPPPPPPPPSSSMLTPPPPPPPPPPM